MCQCKSATKRGNATESLAPNWPVVSSSGNLLWEVGLSTAPGRGRRWWEGRRTLWEGKAEQALQHQMSRPQAPEMLPAWEAASPTLKCARTRVHWGREGLGICACANHSNTRGGLLLGAPSELPPRGLLGNTASRGGNPRVR